MAYKEYSIGKPTYNVEPQAKVLQVDAAKDCYFENTGEGYYAIRRRPGFSLFLDPLSGEGGTTHTGQGIFWSDRFNAAFAVVNGRLIKIMDSVGTHTEIVGTTMNATNPVVFAEGQDLATVPYIYIAHGGRLVYTDGQALISPTDVSTPETCDYVSFANVRFFATAGGQDMFITDTNPSTGFLDIFYWSGSGNPFRSALRADALKAVFTIWDEIALIGEKSIEYWQEDGSNPISPLIGATTEAGIIAPYSLKRCENTLYFLSDIGEKRAVVKLSDRSPLIISDAIDRVLQEMTTVSDAIASLVFVGGLNLYVLHFPTEGVTWAYDFKDEIWTEWGQYDSVSSSYLPFPIVGSCYAKPWNKHLFLSTDGKVYAFDRNTYQDAGTSMRTMIRTGWLYHGTAKRKRANALYLKVKAYSPTAGSLLLRWRDDGRPEWSPYIELPVGKESQEQYYNVLNRCGIYRSRQYEFLMTDNTDLALMGIAEDLTELRN